MVCCIMCLFPVKCVKVALFVATALIIVSFETDSDCWHRIHRACLYVLRQLRFQNG